MKSVTASEARRRWFEILDQVVAGEEVEIERKGVRVVIRREAVSRDEALIPNYGELIRATCVEQADSWTWRWSEESGELVPRADDL